jgi:methylenetetrahydrofolate dehydrogenase (NADP+)/methenyltetrahydrofolate cyclohydrolase
MIIDGKKLAKEREKQVKKEVSRISLKLGRKPRLVAVKLSDDPGSELYLRLKKAAAKRVDIDFELVTQVTSYHLPITDYSNVDGIFVQHPPRQKLQAIALEQLGGPARMPRKSVFRWWLQLTNQIPPEKDVDCLTSTNLQLVKAGKPRFLPATVKAIGYCLLAAFSVNNNSVSKQDDLGALGSFLKEKQVIILGRSPIVGQPLSWWLKNLGADVNVFHSKSPIDEVRSKTRLADVLVSAVGRPGLVTGEMVKSGAVVIDVGSPEGDVRFDEVASRVSAITPIPGGVGPLTVVSLMENVVEAVVLKYQHHTD